MLEHKSIENCKLITQLHFAIYEARPLTMQTVGRLRGKICQLHQATCQTQSRHTYYKQEQQTYHYNWQNDHEHQTIHRQYLHKHQQITVSHSMALYGFNAGNKTYHMQRTTKAHGQQKGYCIIEVTTSTSLCAKVYQGSFKHICAFLFKQRSLLFTQY